MISVRGALLILFCVQFAVSGWYAFREERPPVQPSLQFVDAEAMRFEAACGGQWKGILQLRNAGTVAVRLGQISKSCRCTSLTMDGPEVLNPGQSIRLHASVDAPEEAGRVVSVDVACEYSSVQSPLNGLAFATLQVQAVCAHDADAVASGHTEPQADPLFP